MEDRPVKQAFREKARDGTHRKVLTRRVVRPTEEEIAAGPRACGGADLTDRGGKRMSWSLRTVLAGLILVGLAVIAVHQRLRVTFLGYEIRRLGVQRDALLAEERRLELRELRFGP